MDRERRLIGTGMEVIAKGISQRAFPLFWTVTSYSEVIGKYTDGYLGTGKSGHYFKYVLKLVIRDMALPDGEDLLNGLCDRVRNGLYHVGMTKRRFLQGDATAVPGSAGYDAKQDVTAIARESAAAARSRSFAAKSL